MRVAHFSAKAFEEGPFRAANAPHGLDWRFLGSRLGHETLDLAKGAEAVSAFVDDDLSAPVLEGLAAQGTRLILLRSAGFDHVDLPAAEALGLAVARVPAYSPEAVAEHAVALLLALARRLPKAVNRAREGDFRLEGLEGFELHGKTVAVVGLGKIGKAFARILKGFGAQLLLVDPVADEAFAQELGARFVPLAKALPQAQILSLHAPRSEGTRHLLGAAQLAALPRGAVVVNVGRGELVDTEALVQALLSGHLGGAALDVLEREREAFFRDASNAPLKDPHLARLLGMPNVVLTAHQAFLTDRALDGIASACLENAAAWRLGRPMPGALLAGADGPPRP